MLTFRYGGRNGQPQTLEVSTDHLVVRTRDRTALDERRLSSPSREAISELRPVFRLPRAGVEIHQVAERHRVERQLFFEPGNGNASDALIVIVAAGPGQVHGMQRQACGAGLCLNQLATYCVHRNAVRFLIEGSEQPDQFNLRVLL